LLQDGFLERLTSNEFVCLSQTVDGFVTSTEQISGRRCTTLRATVQSQVSSPLLLACWQTNWLTVYEILNGDFLKVFKIVEFCKFVYVKACVKYSFFAVTALQH